MNFKIFLDEGNSLISKLNEVNVDATFTNAINDFKTKLKSIEEDSDNLDLFDSSYLDNAISESYSSDFCDIQLLAAILYCASFINQYGIITYPNCRTMEYFSDEDLEKLANILDESLVYDTRDFIATDDYLGNCSCAFPS